MGLEEKLPSGILLSTVEGVVNWSRKSSLWPATFTGPKRYNRAKYDAYECGIEPTPQPMGGGRFPVKF